MPKAGKSSAWEEAQVSTQQEAIELVKKSFQAQTKKMISEVTFNPP